MCKSKTKRKGSEDDITPTQECKPPFFLIVFSFFKLSLLVCENACSPSSREPNYTIYKTRAIPLRPDRRALTRNRSLRLSTAYSVFLGSTNSKLSMDDTDSESIETDDSSDSTWSDSTSTDEDTCPPTLTVASSHINGEIRGMGIALPTWTDVVESRRASSAPPCMNGGFHPTEKRTPITTVDNSDSSTDATDESLSAPIVPSRVTDIIHAFEVFAMRVVFLGTAGMMIWMTLLHNYYSCAAYARDYAATSPCHSPDLEDLYNPLDTSKSKSLSLTRLFPSGFYHN